MDISIVICTYNRSLNLSGCLYCLENQKISIPIVWEVLLVDNNSSDNTCLTTQKLINQLSIRIRYVFESKQGLSNARNTGIKESKGTYILFIDDDIRVTENWLQSIYSTFLKYDCDVVGGRIHIESPQQLPKWITHDMYGFLGYQDFGIKPYQMDGIKEFPFGGNMAIHQRVFKLIGDFDPQLGRSGSGFKKEEIFKGEETDFFHRLAAANGMFYYQPAALVHHLILPHQLKIKFFLHLHNNAGILKAKQDKEIYRRNLLGVPFFLFPQLFRATNGFFNILIKRGFNHSIRKLMNVCYFSGLIYGYYKKNE